MKKRTAVTQVSYSVEVTLRQFTRIEKRDEKATGARDFGLLTLLEAKGAHGIEYNGHFGAAVYYTLNFEDVTPAKLAEIEQLIIDYAEGKAL